MWSNLVNLYRKSKLSIMGELAGGNDWILDETGFYDIGYLQSKISRAQHELELISCKLKSSIETEKATNTIKEYHKELLNQREQIIFYIVFLGSNHIDKVEDCIRMCEGHNFGLREGLKALVEYKNGNYKDAFMLLEHFFAENGKIEGHFLLNKVFGLLLIKNGLYKKAEPFLAYAIQFVPNDKECLLGLKRCYKNNHSSGFEVLNEVLEIVG